ncbi:hypothetical protein PV326_001014, partial [Microctonus aethiopoides]
MAQGVLRRKRCPRIPGDLRAYLAKPQICGSVWVIPHFRFTRRTLIESDTNKTNKSSLPGPSLDQEEKTTEPGAGKPRVRYSGSSKKSRENLVLNKPKEPLPPSWGMGGAAQKRREVNALRLSTTLPALSPGGQIKDLSWPLEPMPRWRRRWS